MKTVYEHYQNVIYDNTMKSLFFEEEIDEGFLSTVAGWGKKFFNWLFDIDDDKDYTDRPLYSVNKADFKNGGEKKYLDVNFSKDNIKTVKKLDSMDLVKKLIKISGTDARNQTGLWLFDKELRGDGTRQTKVTSSINTPPYFTNYTAFFYKDTTLKDIAGLASWSLKYNKLEGNESHEHYMHIFMIQTIDKFRGHHLFETYIKELTKIAKENDMKGLTIYAHNNGMIEIYERYGFKLIHEKSRYMAKTF